MAVVLITVIETGGADVSLHDDLILNWAFLDTVTQRSNIDLWLAELEQWKTRAEAAEAALAAVPVEAIYYVWLAAVAHSCDNGNYASKDVIAVDIWLAAQHVKPWEVQPCPKCKGTGYRYNIYGEMAECMDCGARGEAQP